MFSSRVPRLRRSGLQKSPRLVSKHCPPSWSVGPRELRSDAPSSLVWRDRPLAAKRRSGR
eukprot:6006982-Alexandrium_andersonii.AAC.1